MSISLDHRPFFTIIVPCYNSKNKLPRLLDSIVNQNMSNDIEVILCDDCSTEPYQDIVDEYKDKLYIKQVSTDHNSYPGNTREVAAQYATGVWLTNCDHDDSLAFGALKSVKAYIEEFKEEYLVISRYREVILDDNGNEKSYKNIQRDMLLTHGKFFNLDNLWKAYDIHYKKDLKTHEDIYISNLTNEIMEYIGHKPLEIDTYTYNFYQHQDSINSTKYKHTIYNGKEYPFIEVHYNDWCEANFGIYPLLLSKNMITPLKFLEHMLGLIIHDYEFLQGFMYQREDKYIKRNVDIAYSHLVYIKNIFHLTNDQIIEMIRQGGEDAYITAVASVRIQVKVDYENKYEFKDWLEYLTNYMSNT